MLLTTVSYFPSVVLLLSHPSIPPPRKKKKKKHYLRKEGMDRRWSSVTNYIITYVPRRSNVITRFLSSTLKCLETWEILVWSPVIFIQNVCFSVLFFPPESDFFLILKLSQPPVTDTEDTCTLSLCINSIVLFLSGSILIYLSSCSLTLYTHTHTHTHTHIWLLDWWDNWWTSVFDY